MSRRSRAREIALQVLYQTDLNPDRQGAQDEAFVRARLANHDELVAFAMSLVAGVMRNRDELDEMLEARSANWSLDRMAATDRNVLRMGAFELLYAETPDRVAINEAVELSRRFGSAQSSQFVNGLLDRLLKDKKP